jgi:protein TonB
MAKPAEPKPAEPAGATAPPAVNPARPALPTVNPSRSAPPRAADVVQSGPGVQDAERISAPRPTYPELARRLRRSALVVVRALVDENGRVAQTEIVTADGSDLGFNESAVEAVRSLRFRPALRNGTPARMWVEVPVRFTP